MTTAPLTLVSVKQISKLNTSLFFVKQMRFYLKPSVPPHPQGPERERHWHDRVLKAKQPKDEVLHDGVNMVEQMIMEAFL